MYDDILSGFCKSCLSKQVNSQSTVEDTILTALRCGENNNAIGGSFILLGAVATLENEGGCQKCISVLRRVVGALQQS